MPKRGQQLPYRVFYRYPGQTTNRRPHASFIDADSAAAQVGRRGGISEVLLLDVDNPGAEPVVLARYGPGQLHEVSFLPEGGRVYPDTMARAVTHPAAMVPVPAAVMYVCTCGRQVNTAGDIDDHMDRIGRCRFCWGRPVYADPGDKQVVCPACDGSGDAADAYYGDINWGAYQRAPQTLQRLATPPRAGVVPWGTVTDEQGRPAFTAGQLRAAIADLADDAPVLVHVATDDADVADEQIITGAGGGEIGWGDGYGLEPDPIFGLHCHWPTVSNLRVRPERPRRQGETP